MDGIWNGVEHWVTYPNTDTGPSGIFLQEQSYSSLHSGRSLVWDHVRGDTDDPCGAMADFCGVVADFCGVVADPCGAVAIGGRRCDDAVRCATR